MSKILKYVTPDVHIARKIEHQNCKECNHCCNTKACKRCSPSRSGGTKFEQI